MHTPFGLRSYTGSILNGKVVLISNTARVKVLEMRMPSAGSAVRAAGIMARFLFNASILKGCYFDMTADGSS
jgi:hypothetical protein